MSASASFQCIHEVVEALNNNAIFSKWVRFPATPEERAKLKKREYSKI